MQSSGIHHSYVNDVLSVVRYAQLNTRYECVFVVDRVLLARWDVVRPKSIISKLVYN